MIKVPMTLSQGGRMPRTRVRLRNDGLTSPLVTALVDSGASITMAVMDLADKIGLNPASLRQGKSMKVSGIGGKDIYAYAADVDLMLGAPADVGSFEIPSVEVYFADGPMLFGAQVLLGQCGALRKMVFWQRNQDPKPYFGLRPC